MESNSLIAVMSILFLQLLHDSSKQRKLNEVKINNKAVNTCIMSGTGITLIVK